MKEDNQQGLYNGIELYVLLIYFYIFVFICLIGLLDAETGQLVLAGDPKQLGPILRSPFALKYGMGKK